MEVRVRVEDRVEDRWNYLTGGMGAVSSAVLELVCFGLVVVSSNLPMGAAAGTRSCGGESGGEGTGPHQHVGHGMIGGIREEAALHVDAGVHHADHLAIASDAHRGVHRAVQPLPGLADAATGSVVSIARM